MSPNRRDFLKLGACSIGVAALGRLPALADSEPNPFAYRVDHLAKTDPKLIRFDQEQAWKSALGKPRQVAVGTGGRVFVAHEKGIAVFGSDGALITQVPTRGPVRCLAIAGDGSVFAGLRASVQVFDAAFKPLSTWEIPEKRTWLTGIAVADTDVFLADSGNRVILRYDRAGKPVKRIGEKDKDRNIPGLIAPSPYVEVKIASDGLLRVNHPGRHRVEAYTFDGALEFAWGKPTAAIAGFCGCSNPIGVALLPDSRYVTCEKGLPRVKVYTPVNS